MNIAGILELKKQGLPIMKSTFFFRNLEEVPLDFKNLYGDEKRWAMRAFDDRINISANPYDAKDFRINGSAQYGFSFSELEKYYLYLQKEMDKEAIPNEHRLFLLCYIFYDNDVLFSGHAYREGKFVFIDILNGNRPSGRDWTPDESFKVNIDETDSLEDSQFKSEILRICRDIVNFDDGAYMDFTMLKTGYFFYHDLSFH